MNYPLKQVDSSYNIFNLKCLSIAFLVLNCWNKAFGLCSTSSKFCTAHFIVKAQFTLRNHVLVTDKWLKFQSLNPCPPLQMFESKQTLKKGDEPYLQTIQRCMQKYPAPFTIQLLKKKNNFKWSTFCSSQLTSLPVTFDKDVEKPMQKAIRQI